MSVVGIGRATLFFDKPERALVKARQDATDRGRIAIKRAYCGKCGRRNPGEEVAFWMPYAIVALLTLVLIGREILLFYRLHQLIAASDVPVHTRIVSAETIALALLLAGVVWVGWKKWLNRDGGVVWLS